MYSPDTLVSVHPFTRQPEGEEVIIGRLETGVFLAVPPEAVEVLEYLAQGKSVGEASEIFRQAHGEVPDLDEFLDLLEAKGIVRPLAAGNSGKSEGVNAVAQPAQLRYHFSNFPSALAQWIFSLPVLACCFGAMAFAVVLVVRVPGLLPGPRDLYFPDHRTLSWTILILSSYATLFLHELGHLVAARALGINSRMRISHRLWYLVAETDLTGLWSVEKAKRYLPLLAGALIDATSGAVLLLLLFAHNQKWLAISAIGVRVLRAMVFTYMMRLVWQCFLFVRTDFYYVIAGFFNCRNLLGDTENFLRSQAARVLPWFRPVNQSAIPAAEQRVIRVYSVIWVAGRIAALTLLVAISIPVFIRYVQNLAGVLGAGYSAHPGDFVDALLLAAYFLIPFIVGLALWIGSLLRRERN